MLGDAMTTITRVALICIFLMPLTAFAERYQVLKDEDGKTQVQSVPQPSVPQTDPKTLSKDASSSLDSHVPAASPADAAQRTDPSKLKNRIQVRGINESTPAETPSTSESVAKPSEPVSEESVAPAPAAPRQAELTSAPAEADAKGGVTKSSNKFEQSLLRSEGKTREELLRDLEERKARQQLKFDIDGERYVDGDALLEDPSLVEDGPRYFTTQDAEGRPLNIYFDPELEKRAREQSREEKIVLTQGTEYFPQDVKKSEAVSAELDPVAQQLLEAGSKKGFFEAFLAKCCKALPHRATHQLDEGVVIFHELQQDDMPYRFSEGDSRFVLIRLPDKDTNYVVRVKTFIRSFRKMGVDNGMFLPQVTMLDAGKNPVRLIRDIAYRYVEETWTNYGYLEGLFEVNRETENNPEAFMLLSTSSASLRKMSVFKFEDDYLQVQHMPTGSVAVELHR